MKRAGLCLLAGISMAAMVATAAMASANAAPPPPADLHRRVDFAQKLGAPLPLSTRFAERGVPVTLAAVGAGKPMLLSMGYYDCPNLCDLVLASIAEAVAGMNLRPGRDFEVAFIGIDPRATTADTERTRRNLEASHPRANVDRWHLLTGDEASIRAVADAIGYRYFYDPRIDQYAHPAGVVVRDGAGTVSQYRFGVGYQSESLRLSIVAASAGKVGNVIDHLVLLCSGYDPRTGRYSMLIGNALRLLGLASVVLLAGFVLRLHRLRQRRDPEGSA